MHTITLILLQDFDLCQSCYKEVSHPHPMDRLGLGLELDNSQTLETSHKDPKEQRKASIEKCIRFLVHATQCHNVHCKQPSCIKMKRVLTHTRDCKLMLTGKWNQCNVCKQFVLLCISHAKTCKVDKCPVPVCARIKKNLRDQQNQRRVQAQRFMQQRVAQMNSAAAAAAGSVAGGSGAAGSGAAGAGAVNPTASTTPAATAAAAAATVNSSQAGVPSPAPPNTSPGNNTSPSKAKGSPATTHPSNPASNKPYMSVPSPATGPHSVGKGGPRTPTGKAGMMGGAAANSPAVHPHMSPAPGKSDVYAEELTIRKVFSPNDHMRRPPVPSPGNQMMVNHPGGAGGGGGPPGAGPAMNHIGNPMYGSQIQSAPNPMRVQPQHMGGGGGAGPAPPQPGGNFMSLHQQAMMRQQQQHQQQQQQQQQFAAAAAAAGSNPQQYSRNPAAMQGRMMAGGSGGFPQQHPSQLEQILTASPQHHHHPQFNQRYMGPDPHHPQYNQQSSYMAHQVGGTHPPLGPPPQYPVNRAQPTSGGYSQMGPGGGPPGMPRPGMGPMQMGGGGGGGYMYNTNNNNSNNNSSGGLGEVGFNSLPPQDKLSRFVEHL